MDKSILGCMRCAVAAAAMKGQVVDFPTKTRGCQGLFGKSVSGRKWSIGVSCKTQSTAIPVGIASICNAADPFKRPFDGWQGLSEQALGAPCVRVRVRVFSGELIFWQRGRASHFEAWRLPRQLDLVDPRFSRQCFELPVDRGQVQCRDGHLSQTLNL
jgi:hypothetical protein